MTNYFILMADVIRSREIEGRMVLAQLKSITGSVNEAYKPDILSPLTITLGDEFQGVVANLGSAVRIMLHSEELLLRNTPGFRLRYVIHYGPIDTAINPESAHEMVGSGLTEARLKLTSMKKSSRRFYIHSGNPGLDELFSPALTICQYFLDQWRKRDHSLIASFLELVDYKLVAREHDKDVSLMWRRGKSLHIEEYLAIKKLLILLSKSGPA